MKGKEGEALAQQASCHQIYAMSILWPKSLRALTYVPSALCDVNDAELMERTAQEREGEEKQANSVKMREEVKSRWKCSIFLMQSLVRCRSSHEYPTLRIASVGEWIQKQVWHHEDECQKGRGEQLLLAL